MGAGEPVNPEVIDMWRDGTGYHIWEAYGQTETTLCAATFPGMEHRPGSMGVTAPDYYMAVVDDDGNELPDGEEGEIAIRMTPEPPVGMFPGYWRNDEANENCFRGDWYYTGDRATRDEDGYFWFIGRSDDVIISASYRIGPFEVESALLEHDAVAEAAVIAKPDPTRTNIVKAFVVLAPGYEPSEAVLTELQDHVKTTTAPYKYPREVEFLSELPKTISGKIRPDGFVWFTGRSDDVIISESYRIGPFEVESALLEHDAVAEAAVIAKPDPTRTNIVKAFVVLAPGYEPSEAVLTELQDHVKTTTAPYKYPREVEFLTELPKTISGKIRRTELRQREEAK